MARSVQGSNREVLSNSSVSLSEGVYVTNGESLPAIIGKSGYFCGKMDSHPNDHNDDVY